MQKLELILENVTQPPPKKHDDFEIQTYHIFSSRSFWPSFTKKKTNENLRLDKFAILIDHKGKNIKKKAKRSLYLSKQLKHCEIRGWRWF